MMILRGGHNNRMSCVYHFLDLLKHELRYTATTPFLTTSFGCPIILCFSQHILYLMSLSSHHRKLVHNKPFAEGVGQLLLLFPIIFFWFAGCGW